MKLMNTSLKGCDWSYPPALGRHCMLKESSSRRAMSEETPRARHASFSGWMSSCEDRLTSPV